MVCCNLQTKLLYFMKKNAFYFILFLLCFSCKDDNDVVNDCVSRLLPNSSFDTGNTINLNLPFYSSLQFAGNSLFLDGYGVKGIYLHNTGSTIVAFEASDPAHEPNNCSKMERIGIELSCQCGDGYKYQLLTGQQTTGGTGNCLRAYRAERSGNIIRVYN